MWTNPNPRRSSCSLPLLINMLSMPESNENSASTPPYSSRAPAALQARSHPKFLSTSHLHERGKLCSLIMQYLNIIWFKFCNLCEQIHIWREDPVPFPSSFKCSRRFTPAPLTIFAYQSHIILPSLHHLHQGALIAHVEWKLQTHSRLQVPLNLSPSIERKIEFFNHTLLNVVWLKLC